MTAANAQRWRPKEALAALTLRLRFSSGTFSSPARRKMPDATLTPVYNPRRRFFPPLIWRGQTGSPDSLGGSLIRAFESPPPPLTLAMLLGCLARALSRRVVTVAPLPPFPGLARKLHQISLPAALATLSQALGASGRSVRTRVKPTFDSHSPLWGSSVTDFSQSFGRRGKGGRRGVGGWRRQRRGPAFPASSPRSSHPAPLADWNVLCISV